MLKKGKCMFIILIGLIIILSSPLLVFAAGKTLGKDFMVSNLRVRPTLSVNSEYQSNVDLTTSDEKDAMVYRFVPGLSLQVPLERTYIEASGDATYTKVTRGDETVTAHGRGLMRYNLSNKTSLGLSHDYTRGELYGITSDKYHLHQSKAMMKHQLGPRLTLGIGGGLDDYENDLAEKSIYTDYQDYSGDAAIDYSLSRTTTLTLSGAYLNRDYKDTDIKDYDGWRGIVGISNRITPRITVGLNGGYENRNYEKDYETGDVEEYLYGADLDVRLSNFSTLSINYSHSLQDTFYSVEEAVLKTPFDRDAGLLNLLDEDYTFVEVDRIDANLAYNFTDKDTISLGAGYTNSDSDNKAAGSAVENLDEDSYFAGINYSRKFTRWLSLNLGFTYGERSSNVRNKYDYKTTTAGLAIAF